jgi:predicted AlkP superfamily phosphohydrolase/phosphomutase
MTTVVLGLDGAAFELIQPWLDDGSLPALARLIDSGVATDLQSCPPPVTCPNWQCYATGTNPGKLGVFWWERVDAAERTIESTSAAGQFDGTHYWTYLDGRVAVLNLPTSYPPPAVDGVHVAGGPGAEQSGFTNPESFENQLRERHDYTVHPPSLGDLSADSPDSDCVDEIYDLIETRFDVLAELLASGEYEFVHSTVFYNNVLQHFFWDHDVTKRAWERIDARVADLLDDEAVSNLFVMSDHGSNEIERTFHVNAWLEREGYLTTTGGVSDLLHSVGLTRERVRPVLASLGVEWWLRRLVPRRIQMLLPDSEGNVDKSAKAGVVDWDDSVALASGQGPLYVLADDPAERERVREELRSKLTGLSHEGRPIIAAATPAEEVYDGPHLDRGPDLVLRQAPGVHVEGTIGSDADPFDAPDRWRGENKETGLFAAYGADVDSEATLPAMHILDVAPTVLHLHGQPVPEHMDGRVRTDLFADDSDAAAREVRTRAVEENNPDGDATADGSVTDRLEDLGYLS